jgi:non-ribosomal peptide synthetase component F
VPSPLPEPVLRYADYAAWQRSAAAAPELERQIRHWTDRLAGLVEVDLPSDRRSPARPTGRAGEAPLTLDAALAAGLRELARATDTTVFMVMLAALQAVLARRCGHADVVVGVPVAGRTRADSHGTVGLFVNTLVMRTDLSGDPSVRELLARVRATALDAFGNQDAPFDQVVARLAPARSRDRHPLFQVLLEYAPAEPAPAALAGLRVHVQQPPLRLTRFDLELHVGEVGHDELRATLVYARDLFSLKSAQSVASHLGTFLAAMARDPDARIGGLAL